MGNKQLQNLLNWNDLFSYLKKAAILIKKVTKYCDSVEYFGKKHVFLVFEQLVLQIYQEQNKGLLIWMVLINTNRIHVHTKRFWINILSKLGPKLDKRRNKSSFFLPLCYNFIMIVGPRLKFKWVIQLHNLLNWNDLFSCLKKAAAILIKK